MRISDWSSDVCSSDLETPRGREAFASGPQNRAETQPSCEHDAVGNRIIAADVAPETCVGRETAGERAFGLDQAGDAKALGRVKQAVGAVHPDLSGQAEDSVEVVTQVARREIIIIPARRDHTDAQGIADFLLPDRRRNT